MHAASAPAAAGGKGSSHHFISTENDEQNADKARKVILDDDVVDSYFERVKADLIESLTQSEADKEAGQFLLDILMIAKYIERVGDHATNIAEWVVYGLTGAHPEETN